MQSVYRQAYDHDAVVNPRNIVIHFLPISWTRIPCGSLYWSVYAQNHPPNKECRSDESYNFIKAFLPLYQAVVLAVQRIYVPYMHGCPNKTRKGCPALYGRTYYRGYVRVYRQNCFCGKPGATACILGYSSLLHVHAVIYSYRSKISWWNTYGVA
jgi:hypothetical protein